jgi:hypothetical protein
MTFLLTLVTDLRTGSIRALPGEMSKQVTVIALDPTGLAVAREVVQSSTLVADHPAALVSYRTACESSSVVSKVTVAAAVTVASVDVVDVGVGVEVVVAVVVIADKVVASTGGRGRPTKVVTGHGGSIEPRCVPAMPRHMSLQHHENTKYKRVSDLGVYM